MRREGRQHGMVIFYERMPSDSPKRIVNGFDGAPTRGLVTKVSPKPTNHSRYTSRCRRPRCNGCHSHPVQKARLKTKGKNKLVFSGPANGILDLLTDGDRGDGYDDDDDDECDEMGGTTTDENNGDEAMGFSSVRFVWELVEEDGGNWCVVGEDL